MLQRPPNGGGGTAPFHGGQEISNSRDSRQPETFAQNGASTPTGVWPKRIQAGNMKFSVHVYRHEIKFPPRDLPCWTYISQGLGQNEQPEIIFTILRRPNENEENFPVAPVEWMKLVFAMAGSGLNLEKGQMCDLVFENNLTFIKLNNFVFPLNPNQWMSMRRFGGIVHGISCFRALTGVPRDEIPGNSHQVIALTHEEAAVARQFGVTRVIGHVGLAVRWFPHPPFVDRDRRDCVTMADQVGSFRTNLPIARILGFSGVIIDDEIVLTIPHGEKKRDQFRQYVRDTPYSAAMAFECFMDEDAHSGYIWKAGQKAPMAYMSNWLVKIPETS